MRVKVLASVGGLVMLIVVVARLVPFSLGGQFSGNLGQWHALCSSGIGQLGQALSTSVSDNCQLVGLAYDTTWVLGAAGIMLLVTSLIVALVKNAG